MKYGMSNRKYVEIIENANFWTVLKDMEEINVSDELKATILEMREQHRELSNKYNLISRSMVIDENNTVTVTKEMKSAMDELFQQMAEIRKKIKSLIPPDSMLFH